jgi:hypothetical protein
MSDIQCFLLEDTGRENHYLRRYAQMDGGCCGGAGYHSSMLFTRLLGEGEAPRTTPEDPRWPVKCERCDYTFTGEDARQDFTQKVFRRADTGEQMELRAAPVGAMWFNAWMEQWPQRCGPDGRYLVVRTPGGDWEVDSRCSNCDSPCSGCGQPYHAHAGGLCRLLAPGEAYDREKHYYRDARPHKCWVRHGAAPDITVDKAGVTCGAGAGSIMCGNYHGFLRGGRLQGC